jgi:hypothetical protein
MDSSGALEVIVEAFNKGKVVIHKLSVVMMTLPLEPIADVVMRATARTMEQTSLRW